jgi:hypothetical protein
MKYTQTYFRRIIIGALITLIMALVVFPFPSNAVRGINFHSKMLGLEKLSLNAADEEPTISIDNVTVQEGDTGTIDAIFTVSLSETYTDTVTVDYATEDDTATAPDDYVSGSGTVTFPVDTITRPITITVQGDNLDELDETFNVTLSTPSNADIEDATGVGTITDDDTATIDVSSTSLSTDEGGGSDTFTVVLGSEPTDDVNINLSGWDTDEGIVLPTSLVFEGTNWSIPQEITVTGVNDDIDDDDANYTITVTASSTDLIYDEIDPDDVTVTNSDDDEAGISVHPTTGLVTTEGGGWDQFDVVLTSEPVGSVTVQVSSSDTTEGTVTTSFYSFNAENWDIPRTVIVTGEDDFIVDSDIPYTIETFVFFATDSNYNGLTADDVSVINSDDDTAGFLITPTTGLSTAEDGSSDTFTVVLTSQPTHPVTINLSSSDPGEGTPSPSSLVFPVVSWNIPISVTVTGVDDALMDGDIGYTILTAPAVSEDDAFSGENPPDVSVTNYDDDNAGVTITPTSGLVTTEAGGSDTFTVTLTSQPSVFVRIYLDSNDTEEGKVSPRWLTFYPGQWNIPQEATITGVNDSDVDGDIPYMVETTSSSGDSDYDDIDVEDVSVTNLDDDVDTVPPTVEWLSPEVENEEVLTINNSPGGQVIQLEASATDISGVEKVRFRRWDSMKKVWVDIATVYTPPYQTDLDTNDLNCRFNQINAEAYDTVGNNTIDQYLIKRGATFYIFIRNCYIYMPMIIP